MSSIYPSRLESETRETPLKSIDFKLNCINYLNVVRHYIDIDDIEVLVRVIRIYRRR